VRVQREDAEPEAEELEGGAQDQRRDVRSGPEGQQLPQELQLQQPQLQHPASPVPAQLPEQQQPELEQQPWKRP